MATELQFQLSPTADQQQQLFEAIPPICCQICAHSVPPAHKLFLPSQLLNHIAAHLGYGPHKCVDCAFTGIEPDELMGHLGTSGHRHINFFGSQNSFMEQICQFIFLECARLNGGPPPVITAQDDRPKAEETGTNQQQQHSRSPIKLKLKINRELNNKKPVKEQQQEKETKANFGESTSAVGADKMTYNCSKCNFICLRAQRKNHYASKHLKLEMYRCKLCKKGFGYHQKTNINYHFRAHHSHCIGHSYRMPWKHLDIMQSNLDILEREFEANFLPRSMLIGDEANSSGRRVATQTLASDNASSKEYQLRSANSLDLSTNIECESQQQQQMLTQLPAAETGIDSEE